MLESAAAYLHNHLCHDADFLCDRPGQQRHELPQQRYLQESAAGLLSGSHSHFDFPDRR